MNVSEMRVGTIVADKTGQHVYRKRTANQWEYFGSVLFRFDIDVSGTVGNSGQVLYTPDLEVGGVYDGGAANFGAVVEKDGQLYVYTGTTFVGDAGNFMRDEQLVGAVVRQVGVTR